MKGKFWEFLSLGETEETSISLGILEDGENECPAVAQLWAEGDGCGNMGLVICSFSEEIWQELGNLGYFSPVWVGRTGKDEDIVSKPSKSLG